MSDPIVTNEEIETTDSELTTTDKLVFVAVGAAATVLGVSIYRAVRKIRKMESHEAEVHKIHSLDEETEEAPAN